MCRVVRRATARVASAHVQACPHRPGDLQGVVHEIVAIVDLVAIGLLQMLPVPRKVAGASVMECFVQERHDKRGCARPPHRVAQVHELLAVLIEATWSAEGGRSRFADRANCRLEALGVLDHVRHHVVAASRIEDLGLWENVVVADHEVPVGGVQGGLDLLAVGDGEPAVHVDAAAVAEGPAQPLRHGDGVERRGQEGLRLRMRGRQLPRSVGDGRRQGAVLNHGENAEHVHEPLHDLVAGSEARGSAKAAGHTGRGCLRGDGRTAADHPTDVGVRRPLGHQEVDEL
mmetsp:Transcript_94498/g.185329  ORF Transcript_94498/g.185329 Transcript_94498/m.185329 type:complete len:287 (-) Transcript_94498:23-883(-)